MNKKNIFSSKLTFPPRLNSINQDDQKGGIPMTIIIGALCDGGNTVLLLSDKRITTVPHEFVFESQTKKIDIDSNSSILTSGVISNLVFIKDSKVALQEQVTIKGKAEIIAQNFSLFRAYKFTQEYLSLHGILNFNDFHSKQKYLNDSLVGGLIEQEKIYNIGVELILGGVDGDGGHLYNISHPGTHYNQDMIGFCSAPILTNSRVGTIFEFCNYTTNSPLSKVLSIAFIAKKRTEILGGIGEKTEAWAINSAEGIKEISEETMLKLEGKYIETKKKLSSVFNKIEIEEKEISYQEKENIESES